MYHFALLTTMYKSSNRSISSTAFGIASVYRLQKILFMLIDAWKYSSVVKIFIFLLMLSIFSCAYLPSIVFFSEMSFQFFCPFFYWIVRFTIEFEDSLHILDSSYQKSTLQIFSHKLQFVFSFSYFLF